MSQSRDTGYALEITGIAHHREIPRKALAFKGGSLRSLRALMNARRRNRALSSGPFHTDVEHPRRGHGTTFIEQEHEAAPSADNAEFQGALLIDRSVQSGRHRRRAVCRVAGNPDRMAAETLDAVMAALGLNVNQRTAYQVLARDDFSRRRIQVLTQMMPNLGERLQDGVADGHTHQRLSDSLLRFAGRHP